MWWLNNFRFVFVVLSFYVTTYKRKPEEQLNIRFKKEGKLYGALNIRPSILVISRNSRRVVIQMRLRCIDKEQTGGPPGTEHYTALRTTFLITKKILMSKMVA